MRIIRFLNSKYKAHSSCLAGNHAQGVAMTCKNLVQSHSYAATTPTIKINAVKKLGSKVILSGDTYDEAYNFAIKFAKEKIIILCIHMMTCM